MTNVFVNRTPVGRLTREEINRFAYEPDVSPGAAVSLLMPVSETSYLAERPRVLHPVFDMSLPEGPLREALARMFAKTLPVFDDLALLEIVGRSAIGRLRYGASAEELDQVPPQNLRDLLHQRGTADLFQDLLQHYARYSGVAGVQPKLLIRDNGELLTDKLSPVERGERLTAHGTTHLVKTFEAARYPGLATNEWLCLQAARAAELPTPPAELSDDGRLLIVERFDLKPDGTYLAFEDGCALGGRIAAEKYEGSYEQLAATFAQFIQGRQGVRAELRLFFRSLVLSVVLRNGDAHRKNFGLLYDSTEGGIWLAPTFDVVTTTVYLPKDTLALTLDGTKRWPNRKRLERFGVQRCLLAPREAQEEIERVLGAVSATLPRLAPAAGLQGAEQELRKNLQKVWQEGIASLRMGA